MSTIVDYPSIQEATRRAFRDFWRDMIGTGADWLYPGESENVFQASLETGPNYYLVYSPTSHTLRLNLSPDPTTFLYPSTSTNLPMVNTRLTQDHPWVHQEETPTIIVPASEPIASLCANLLKIAQYEIVLCGLWNSGRMAGAPECQILGSGGLYFSLPAQTKDISTIVCWLTVRLPTQVVIDWQGGNSRAAGSKQTLTIFPARI